MSSLLLKNGYVLTLDGADTTFESGDVLIVGNRIKQIASAIDPGEARPERVMDASGMLVMPGLINAHVHSYENLFRGAALNLPNELWNLLIYPPIGAIELPARLYYLRAALGALEMIKTGVTTIQDNSSNWFTAQDPAVAEAYWGAYRDLGVRTCVAIGLLDRPWLHTIPHLEGLLPAEILAELQAREAPSAWDAKPAHALIDACEAAIRQWHRPADRFTVAIAPSAPQRCSDELLVRSMELAERHDLGVHTHFLETRIQRLLAGSFYETSILRHLDRLGFLKPRTCLVHAVWATSDDIQLLAERRCSVVHCPSSNLRMGSGIMPLAALRQAGVPMGLGADGTAGSDSQSMFYVMNLAALLHTVSTADYEAWPTSHEVLRMATRGNARCLWAPDELGSLAPGRRADVILLDLRHSAFTPLHDVKNQLVFSQAASAVRTVIVDGQVIVDDGVVLGIDEYALLDEVRSYAPLLREQLARAQAQSRGLRPYLDQVYRKAVEAGRD